MSPARGARERVPTPGSRERLLEAAVELIAERGYAGTSVGEVCERAGVARTALYWHYGNKEGLLAAVLTTVGTTWIEEIRKRAYLEGEPLQRVHRLVAEWRRIVAEQPQLIRLPLVVQLEQGAASERTLAALRKVWSRAEEAIVQGIEDSVGMKLPDLDLVAHTIVALLQGATLRPAVDPDPERLDRIFDELERTIVLLIWVRLPRELQKALGTSAPERAPRDPESLKGS